MKWVVVVRDLDEHGDLYGDPAAGHQDLAQYAYGSYVTPPMSHAKARREALFIAIRAWGHYQDESDGELIGVAAMLAGSADITAADNPIDFHNLPPGVQRQSKEKRQLYWLIQSLKTHTGVEIDILPVGRRNAFR